MPGDPPETNTKDSEASLQDTEIDPDLRQWARYLRTFAIDMVADYKASRPPFDELEVPELTHIKALPSVQDQLKYCTFGVALDYQRPADRHWKTMTELWRDYPELFCPGHASTLGQSYLSSLFSSYGIRFPNRDSRAWIKIAKRLTEDHDGSVYTLIQDCDCDAPTLVDELNAREYPHLTGDKLQPFYIKMLGIVGVRLWNLSEVEIPVDIQIRKVSKWLCPELSEDSDNERFRQLWRGVAHISSLHVLDIDGPLWLLGSGWDDGGKSYVDRAAPSK